MSAIATIEKVLSAEVLASELTVVPTHGATDAEIREEEMLLNRKLRPGHKAVLQRWNGIALDIIRFFGCGKATGEIGRLSALQLKVPFPVREPLIVGSDASGFAYIEASDGRIFSFDTDGGTFTPLASSLDDFIDRLVFGRDAALFAGDEWCQQLRHAGLI